MFQVPCSQRNVLLVCPLDFWNVAEFSWKGEITSGFLYAVNKAIFVTYQPSIPRKRHVIALLSSLLHYFSGGRSATVRCPSRDFATLPPMVSLSLTSDMSYFRQSRSSRPVLALGTILVITLLYFFLGPTTELSFDPLLRARKSAAAAANPLSPPTSAFRKSGVGAAGQQPFSPPPIIHYQLNNLTATKTPAKNNEKILVLTPLARFYQAYWDNLVGLTYPHEHISVAFIIPKTKDGNEATKQLQEAITVTQSGPLERRFESVIILRQDFEPAITSQDEKERHAMANQAARRASMAKARNSLLFTTISPSTSWILWLDGDIVETPVTLIDDLASFDKDIIVPNCFQRYTDDNGKAEIRPYDYNSWRDSDTAKEIAAKMGPDDVLLEGYAEMATYRTLMAMLADTGETRDTRRIMPLDGVGGTALMVKAAVHRDGAMFPPFSFYHLIETEGFAKMAKRLGYDSWGLPNYFVSYRETETLRRLI